MPSSAPHADSDGLRLPDGSYIILQSGNNGSSWVWRTRYGDDRPIEALTIILDQSTFSAAQEATALEKLRVDREMQNIAGLVSLTALYLAYEVARRSGVATLQRVGFVMVKGEIGALAIGALVIWLLAPSVLGEEFPAGGRLLAVILYAQLALFIGVFTLLFEEKSVTAPLAEPYT